MSMSMTTVKCQAPILRLPFELLLEIVTVLWSAAVTEADRLSLMHCLSLVCKDIAAAYNRVSQQVVTIASEEFYSYYMRRLSKVHQSHPMNTCCDSLHFYVDNRLNKRCKLALPRLTNIFFYNSPFDMQRQQDGLEYFCNGKDFVLKGLLPNLTHLLVTFYDCRDAYHALFPHFMPRTVQTVHINYLPSNSGSLYRRRTPIRYPSIRHKLKRLTVTGNTYKMHTIARLWESLFEIEELIVDGEVLPVGEDAAWSLDMDQALDMLESGCKGIGWNWLKHRPSYSSDRHYHANWGYDTAAAEETVGQEIGDFSVQPAIRRLKSFSHLHDSLTKQKTPRQPMRRSKSCTVLSLANYPYGLRVWHLELLTDYCKYQSDIKLENLDD